MACVGALETASDENKSKASETSAKTDHPRNEDSFRFLATKTHQFAVSGCLRTAISRPLGCTPEWRKRILRVVST